MFENSDDYVVSSQEPLCRSFCKNTVIGNTKEYVEGDNIIEGLYKSILDELIDNAVLELCFEVHRTTKLSFPIPDKFTPPYSLMQSGGRNAKSTKSILCFICGVSKGPNKFTSHLYDCMRGHEVNSRKARAKKINFKESDSEDEEYDEYGSDALRKSRSKKVLRGKSRLLGNSLPKPSCNSTPSYMDMSIDEKRAFFDKKCGVVTKRTKKLCSNPPKCAIHTDMERSRVRLDLLRDEPDNGQIDVDTVVESDIKPSFSMCDGSISDYSSGSLYF